MALDRDYILKDFLRLISRISDKEFQMRVWIKGIGPECIDFDETCDYFFVEGVDVIKNYKDYGITEHQHEILEVAYSNCRSCCREAASITNMRKCQISLPFSGVAVRFR